MGLPRLGTAADGGWELVGVLGLLSLTLAVVGAGRVSLDNIFSRSTSGRAKVAA
ncbi:hypothetical protein [Kribbella swartbergensis]